MKRRTFLKQSSRLVAASSLPLLAPRPGRAGTSSGTLEAGEATVDITPPIGTVISGFHYSPGNERRVTGVRQPTSARALVLRASGTEVAFLSVDVVGISRPLAQRIRRRVEQRTGIPASRVRVTATHSHSTPTARYLRQWGGEPQEYIADMEAKCVAAVEQARADLTESELYLGSAIAEGANFNRTIDTWKNEDEFTADATDDERWLDRTLHVLHFERRGVARSLLWYHFSAHPVCFTDTNASPDWPGLVAESLQKREGITPSFLQGHIGDVNPGDGAPWLGDPGKIAKRISKAIAQALGSSRRIAFDAITTHSSEVEIPFDMELHLEQLARYAKDPQGNSGGEYVDAGFAKDWYESAKAWSTGRKALPSEISIVALGDLALFFHAAELFSYYALRIRHESPFRDTILVGYADGFVGYLTDPASHEKREYAAAVVPKILDLPPFTPTATRSFTTDVVSFIKEAHG